MGWTIAAIPTDCGNSTFDISDLRQTHVAGRLLDSYSNSLFLFLASAAPVSHPGRSGKLHEYSFIERKALLLKESPPDSYSHARWYTSMLVPGQSKDKQTASTGWL